MKIISKLLCKESYYYNLTSPYYYFNKGEWYEFIITTSNGQEYIKNEKNDIVQNIYSCTYCDFIATESQILRIFQTQEDYRNEQLNKII